MASKDSPVILVSIAAATAITITKFVAAILSGSSGMVSEGLHSLASTVRSVLLLVGSRMSRRKSDSLHPFGHGKELFFWTLIAVLLVIIVAGAGSIYQGIVKLVERESIADVEFNYIVLGIAGALGIAGWIPAIREVRSQRGGRSVWQTLWNMRDTATLAIYLDGVASVIALVLATLGIYLSDTHLEPAYDGVAAILIGVMWFVVLVPLVQRCRQLLVGEGAEDETLASITEMVAADPDVRQVVRSRAMSFGVEDLLVSIGLRFREDLSASELGQVIRRIEDRLREHHDGLKHISIEAHP
ncbi:MAG TPA: cation diffusion facilitator family transporter [Nannocystis sp.]